MFWQENDDAKRFQVPDDIVDVVYRIDCKCLPLEHAHALSQALHQALPWLAEEDQAGVHLIHGAESGNGWMRPEDPSSELLHLSRRTRMSLRLPKERIQDAEALTGQVLDIAGYTLEVGESSVKPLQAASTLFARYVVNEHGDDEEAFLAAVAGQMADMGVSVRKLMCGKSHTLSMPDGTVETRTVLVAELERPESVRLQQQGVGPGRRIGCGLFIPHKGIAPVASLDDD